MNYLLKRLRFRFIDGTPNEEVMAMAADEIDRLCAELTALKQSNSAYVVSLPSVPGEVQRWVFGPHGEYVRAQDYAALNEHSALVEMKLQAEVERLRTALKTVGDDYPGSSCQQWCYEQAGYTIPSPDVVQS